MRASVLNIFIKLLENEIMYRMRRCKSRTLVLFFLLIFRASHFVCLLLERAVVHSTYENSGCVWRENHNMHDWRQFTLISVSFLSLSLFTSSVFYSRFRFLHVLPIDVIKRCMYKIFMALFPSSVLFQFILLRSMWISFTKT